MNVILYHIEYDDKPTCEKQENGVSFSRVNSAL